MVAIGGIADIVQHWQRNGSVANDPQRHFATVNCRIAKSQLDYLDCAAEERERDSEAKRLGSFEVARSVT